MAKEDKNGCLHGDKDGKFVSKNKTENKPYDSKDNFGELKKKVNKPNIIDLPDEQIPKSLGAQWKNEEVSMPDGSIAKFVEGGKITHKQVFAGKGTKKPIRDVERLTREYPKSKSNLWQKVKGRAYLDLGGEYIYSEIHWYEEPSIGKVEIKFKKEL